MSEERKGCPHKPLFDQAGRVLSSFLPNILADLGIGEDKGDLVVVIVSRVCGCAVCVADTPASAREAARRLNGSADHAEQLAAERGSVVELFPKGSKS